ncbi:MAG: hypothetical protein KTR32_06535 [Granulosicoccus sp.]|nr:hypothetical protein [Granulosicoccus sp.]
MTELIHLTACELVERLKSGAVAITDVLDELHNRIESVNPIINALPTLCIERAYERAVQWQERPLHERGQLCGLPVSIKDLTPVSGVRTTYGSLLFEDFVPTTSDQMVRRIESTGGIVYAKSNTPEFGAGGITFNEVFGVTKTPYNIALASGGSSGGAAASLASGCAWLSHGSDMAGSLRTPAAFCGVTSLRPSPGLIQSDSEFLPYQILGLEGPMARDITDLALFADVMHDAHSKRFQNAVSTAFEKPLKQSRVAYSVDLGITSVSQEIEDVFQRFLSQLEPHCDACVEAQPNLTNVHESFDVLRANHFAVNLEQDLRKHKHLMKPEVIWNVEMGIQLSSEAIREALRQQGRIIGQAAAFMQNYDVLICPATSVGYVDASLRYPGETDGVPIPEYYRWLAIAYATTMTALPVITLPAGSLSNDMPFAIQLVGKPHGESALFQIAHQIEAMIGRDSSPIDPEPVR